MRLSDNALKVLQKRYFLKDNNGNPIEDWRAMIDRVAGNIAGDDPEKKLRYARLLDSGLFLPNSPTLMNAGNDLQQLSACFVLPVEDSMDSIFETIKNAALIHKSGGGTGFSFSRLREANARVRSTNGVSSGPISFLKVFNAATDAVKQGGTRRGANMAILSVDHPQVMEFVTCKEDPEQLTNFNISVGLTEEFMEAVRDEAQYDLISPHTRKVAKRLNAGEVMTIIVEMAHKNGEPGIVFLDRINRFNPTPHIGTIESTNPCGEQPLLPNEACNLGSINLAEFIIGGAIDWEHLKSVVRDAVDFLDDVIDRSRFPLPQIDEIAKANRKIGLGIMGWADFLFTLGIPYDSEQGVTLAEEVMEFIDFHAKTRSMELAVDRGPFPNFKGSIYERGILHRDSKRHDWNGLAAKIKEHGIRNATVTTIAPTGTISMIADTSSGIEPQFSLVFVKHVLDGEKLLYINPVFEQTMRREGFYKLELLEEIAQSGSLKDIESIPASLRRIFVTSHDIAPEWHIRMQAAFQKYTDNAVSKTINFPEHATREDIRTAFELAWELGCKGVTVYRDGSRKGQVLNVGKKVREAEEKRIAPRQRPEITTGVTQRVETGCGHLYVTINSDEHGPCELFSQIGKVGGCASAQMEAIARLTSLCLRSDIQVDAIARQLRGIRCPSPMWHKGKMINSCADGVAHVLDTFSGLQTEEKKEEKTPQKPAAPAGRICPDCGSPVEFTEGCMKCNVCGWSKC